MSAPLSPRTARSAHEERFGPNMTPMIDVVLVILIFFMAGSTFLGQEWFIPSEIVQRGSPQDAKDPLELPPVPLHLEMSRAESGAALVSGMGPDPLGLEAFEAAIAEFTRDGDASKVFVVVNPGQGVTYDEVVRLHDACRAAGIERIGLTPR